MWKSALATKPSLIARSGLGRRSRNGGDWDDRLLRPDRLEHVPLVRIPLYIPFKRRQDLFHGSSNIGHMIFTPGEEQRRLADGDVGVIVVADAERRQDRRSCLEGDLNRAGGE